ncbi:MAG: type I-C CRISPR-associated endonuclease Cas1c [Clostridiales bacterium]|nr:type I-C CRISPR-associated endonuclease Cas1c [Clostridiales bacterium]
MKQLLNTLFVTSEDIYLSLEGENVLANRDREVIARYPLHTLQTIVSFSYSGASPALMGACAEKGIGLAFCTPRGRFLARVCGESSGNVLLRREQYRIADDSQRSCAIARTMIFGKLSNCAASVQRTLRDHALRVTDNGLEEAVRQIKELLPQALSVSELDTLRGLEGVGAAAYFGVFDHLLLNRKEDFFFHGRNRRPPLDRVNAMLSFAYSLLAHDCASALESVGLDAYVGFLHRDRPGRESLALDLMEELRPCMADRFVLTLVNNRMIRPEDFQVQDSGAVLLTDDGRKKFLKAWQERKRDTLTHPYLNEKMSWGLIPYVQALLLARYLRGDLDAYPPFLWK